MSPTVLIGQQVHNSCHKSHHWCFSGRQWNVNWSDTGPRGKENELFLGKGKPFKWQIDRLSSRRRWNALVAARTRRGVRSRRWQLRPWGGGISRWHSCQTFGSRFSHNKRSRTLTVNLISPAPILCTASGELLPRQHVGRFVHRHLGFAVCLVGASLRGKALYIYIYTVEEETLLLYSLLYVILHRCDGGNCFYHRNTQSITVPRTKTHRIRAEHKRTTYPPSYWQPLTQEINV